MPAKKRDEQDIKITGRYVDFAREVRRLMGWGVPDAVTVYTLRMTEGKTGVSFGTIDNMVKGHRPKADTIVRFAKDMPGANVDVLMTLAGFKEADRTAQPGLIRETRRTTYVTDPDAALEGASRSNDMTDEERAVLQTLIEMRRRRKRGEE